jgi:DNA polymerase III delta prime subunit
MAEDQDRDDALLVQIAQHLVHLEHNKTFSPRSIATNALLNGPSGVGKTSTAIRCALSGTKAQGRPKVCF